MKLLILISALIFANLVRAESGPDNGTDYVKILFTEARETLNERLSQVSDVQNLAMDVDVKTWLMGRDEKSNSIRLQVLKAELQIFELRFQTSPCLDSSQRESSICFLYDAGRPVVLVSLQQNRLTTSTQAMAMLIHESGHLMGEMDHLFLDRVGVQLVANLQPQIEQLTRISKEISANPFSDKEACDQGHSTQAKILLESAIFDLKAQCSEKKRQCDFSQSEHFFQGEVEWIQGQGYTMKVICSVRLQVPAL